MTEEELYHNQLRKRESALMTNSIKVYTKDNCMQCTMSKQVLNAQGTTFDEIHVDVENDIETLDYLRERGVASFPAIVKDEDWGNVISGFRPDELKKFAPAKQIFSDTGYGSNGHPSEAGE